jgi:ribA/ribD-fused uncharacterized protein
MGKAGAKYGRETKKKTRKGSPISLFVRDKISAQEYFKTNSSTKGLVRVKKGQDFGPDFFASYIYDMINRFSGEYKFLSNFYLVDIFNKYDNCMYKSVEHAYMSMKSDLSEWKAYCRGEEVSCGEVKRKSYELNKLIDGWEEKKLEFMKTFVTYKFLHHKDLQKQLIDTGEQNLIEGNYHGDIFWGMTLLKNPNEGENHLGRILMNLRSELKSLLKQELIS